MNKCRLIDEGVCISASGDVLPCCVLPYSDSKKERFTNNTNINELDFDFYHKNWCHICEKNERNEGTSMMSRIEKFFEYRNEPVTDKKHYLDISFGNTCDLDCVMCSNNFSSKWNKIIEKKPKGLNFLTSKNERYTHSLSYDEIDHLIDSMPDLKYVTIKGGEPFYDKKSLYFIDKVAERNINFRVVTNGVNPNWKIVEKIKNLDLVMSVDGIFEIYEWIRGTSFSNLVENYKRFRNITDKMSINFTVTAFNVDILHDTHDFFRSIDSNVDFDFLIAHEPYLHYRQAGQIIVDNVDGVVWDRPPSTEERQQYKMFKNFMNEHRGFAI